jgi:hypothetical protein
MTIDSSSNLHFNNFLNKVKPLKTTLAIDLQYCTESGAVNPWSLTFMIYDGQSDRVSTRLAATGF